MNQISDLSPRPLPCRDGFTLIELLVVISIIAILAGLLLPVVSKVTDNARKTVAKSAATQMVTAVNNFQTDYGQYPVPTTVTPAYTAAMDYAYGTDGHNYQLFQVLRATETATTPLNSRKVVYFEGKNVKNTNTPYDGFIQITSATTKSTAGLPGGKQVVLQVGDLVDPWGNCYLVRIDTSYSSTVINPYKDSMGSATTTETATSVEADLLRFGVVAMSLGIDGQLATGGTAPASPYTVIGDDVVSWQ